MTEFSEVRPRVARLTGAVGAFLGLIGLGVIAGVLVTALTAPVIAVAGVGVTTSIGAFEASPSDIRPDALSQKSNIYATRSDGTTVLLASIFDQDRQMVGWNDISQHAKDALVATEDPRFYSHGGVDLQSSMRALLQNVSQGGVTSGASTISMQYVKNILVQRAENLPTAELQAEAYQAAVETSLSRKVQEMRLAMGIDKEYSKDDILLGYLNIVLFGGRVYGIESAANYYFGVSARDLTVAQSASLIAIVQNPENLRLDVESNIVANQARRDLDVLPAMLRENRISAAQFEEALATPVTPIITPPSTGCQTAVAGAGFFCDFVRSEIRGNPAFGAEPETRLANLNTGGFNIFTTLDLDLQSSADANVTAVVPSDFPGVDLGGTVVSVEPGTGKIRAMAQNRAYSPDDSGGPGTTALNYNVDAIEGGSSGFQVGSTYKVFVLAEWLKQGRSLNTIVNGNVRSFEKSSFQNRCQRSDVGPWSSGNDGSSTPGSVSVLRALTQSINNAFITMTQQLDLCDIKETAEAFGVHRADGSPLGSVPSDSLGTQEISPLTMANAYAAIAANGLYCAPTGVERVVDSSGVELPLTREACSQALDPALNQQLVGAMEQVMTAGTGTASNPRTGIQHIGKTGTTNGEQQTWMVGASSRLATAVWVGNVTGDTSLRSFSINGARADGARHTIFRDHMRLASALYGGEDFPRASIR